MNDKLKNSLILLPILAAVGYASVLLYQDYHHSNVLNDGTKTKEQVGQMLVVENNVKRQGSDDVIWDAIEKNVPVYDKDSVRTGKDSSAIIKLTDNSIIELSENSLIVLEKSPENLNIRFKSGDLSTKNLSKSLKINVSGSTLSGEGSEMKVKTGVNSKTQVTVAKGRASITDKNKKKTELNPDQQADIDDAGLNTLSPVGVTLKSPQDKSQIQTSKDAVAQPFTWQVSSPRLQQEILEISKTQNFDTKDTITFKAHQGITATLKAGTYYWRVGFNDDQNMQFTQSWRLTIGDEKRITLLYPENSSHLNLSAEENSVDLQWSSPIKAKLFVTEVATSTDFKNLAISHTVKETKDQIKNLPPQTYYWHVKAFGEGNEELSTSSVFSFTIKVKIPRLPDLIRPPDESLWSSPEPVIFEWKKMDKAVEYRILISMDEDQKEILKTKVLTENSMSWPWPHQGPYFWSVRALAGKAQMIGQSEIYKFTVKARDKGPAFELVSPKDQTDVTRELQVNPQPVTFQWKILRKLTGPLTLSVSPSAEFQEPVIKQEHLTGLTTPVTLTKPGIYYWKISSLSIDGKLHEVSPVYSFNLKAINTLLPPQIIEPAMKDKIEVTEATPVKFSWSAVKEAAQYHIIVSRTDQQTSVAVLDRTVKETTVTSTPLPEGRYSWTVTSVDAQGEEGLAGQAYEFSVVPQEIMDAPKLNAPVVK